MDECLYHWVSEATEQRTREWLLGLHCQRWIRLFYDMVNLFWPMFMSEVRVKYGIQLDFIRSIFIYIIASYVIINDS